VLLVIYWVLASLLISAPLAFMVFLFSFGWTLEKFGLPKKQNQP